MKALFITPALICTLLMSIDAAAENHGQAADPHAKAAAHAPEKGHRDNNALFPQPKADVVGHGTPPKAPELSTPAFQAKVPAGNVMLQWKASTGADLYHVQVATDPAFKWLKADDKAVKGTTFEAKDLEKGKTYYWRVAPWKSGNMASSNKGTFAPSVFETE